MLSWAKAFLDRSELLRHAAILMAGTVVAQVIVLALTTVLTRIFSPTAYGQFAVYSSIVAIITVIATLRYDLAIMLPKSDSDAAVLKGVVTRVVIVVSVLATLACGIAAPLLANLFNSPGIQGWLWVAGVSVFTLGELSGLIYWLNRKKRYREISINRIQQSGTTALAQLALGFASFAGVGGLIVGSIIGQGAAVATLRWKTRGVKELRAESTHSRRSIMKRYRKMPLLNGPTALIDAVRLNGINILIGVYSVAALGQFSMAWRLLEVPAALISGALSQVFFQRFAVTQKGSMLASARRSVVRTGLLGVVPFGLIYFLAPWLFPIVLGPQWGDAGYYAQALVPWLFMNVITSPISTLFVVAEAQQYLFAFSVVYMVVPLTILTLLRSDMLLAITAVGWAMAAMLCVFIVMAFWVAKRHDRDDGTAVLKSEAA
ncbi:oligosaccharide flippase family protein [Rathayibacter soli]|uniref:oligosaccharide flippase family protein n=1 Tax=Rathayibacter soli TaxID=3144168 RepID=UPI0027E52981|nr:oligosaccharide flippase family protein [Glaciibacter superstes]